MATLIDTNIIIRFLIGDHKEQLVESTRIFEEIESGNLQVEILDVVLMEVLFVLTKFYDLPKAEVVTDLKAILAMEGVINSNKVILFEALSLFVDKNVDFVDALICTKSKLQGYEWLSFDRDVIKNCR
ncbi:PIN domain nuclease [Methylococcaceae bacterium HT1]|nr:PIN domain nuclease [Methylococcaceae bacterium HT1]TXL12379.1 PIN domain nuclease [Methylococcaceae bacterium HT4]TXL16651.1 PIN domain nuclease [Methylococcaceae bacterium HT5]